MPNPIQPPDPGGLAYEIFKDSGISKRPLKISIAIAIFFHLLLFFVVLPSYQGPIYSNKDVLINLRSLAPPPAPKDKEGLKKDRPSPPKAAAPKIKTFIPFPDPTPDAPEPLVFVEAQKSPVVVEEINNNLDPGETVAPSAESGGGKGQQGAGPGSRTGPGGAGESVYRGSESGVEPPVLLAKPLPLYSEEARRKRIEGAVVLRAIIDKNGRVTDIQIIKSLDPSLDESAIQTVVNKWRFRPATLNGQPVLFEINIVIEFHLY